MNCGGDHASKRDAYPAFGCTCYKCQRQNYYSKMCLSKKVSTRQCNEDEFEYDSTDNDFVIGSLQLNIAELEQRDCDLKGCKKKKNRVVH